MTAEERIKLYEAKTNRLEAYGKMFRNVCIGIATIGTFIVGLVTALKS